MATVSILETTELVSDSLKALESSGSVDSDILQGQLYPGAYGLLDTLVRYDVDEIRLGEFDPADPRATLETVFEAGQSELDIRGLPHPNLSFYQDAMSEAQASGVPMADAVSAAAGARPLAMQSELNSEAGFNVSPVDDVTGATAGPLMATAAAEATPALEAEPQNYQAYDVHIVAYPLKTIDLPFTDADLVMRDMHSFLIVTEPGADPTVPENVVLGMRGGPDDDTAWLSGSSESSVGDYIEDAPAGSRKSGDGDLYVQGTEAAIADLDTPHVTVIQTARVTGDLGEMGEKLEGLAEIINDADINYVGVDAMWSGMNCNVVSGDGFELLTGREPVNPYERWGLDEMRLPGLGEDAMNYEETEYAPLFD